MPNLKRKIVLDVVVGYQADEVFERVKTVLASGNGFWCDFAASSARLIDPAERREAVMRAICKVQHPLCEHAECATCADLPIEEWCGDEADAALLVAYGGGE